MAIKEIHAELVDSLGLVRGVTHTEFLKAHADQRFYFLEIAARIGGAYISNVVQAATGINLWREWAHLEVGAGKQPYQLPQTQQEFAGVIVSLARQQEPDTSSYNDPEIVYRITKFHHAGFVLKSSSPQRIEELLSSYTSRFISEFLATHPFRISRPPSILWRLSLVLRTATHLFFSLVTLKHPHGILCLLHASRRSIFCLPRAGNLRGVCYPWEVRCGVTKSRIRRKLRNRSQKIFQ